MTDESTALKLAELKASIDLGLEKVNGSLALLLQRQDQSDEKTRKLEKELDDKADNDALAKLADRIEVVEQRKYVSPGAVITIASFMLTALGVIAAFLAIGH